jgi:urease accessory protein
MTAAADAQLALMAWLSPSFPVGAFAYSHGLEAAQHSGRVTDPGSLESWLTDLARRGSLWNDLCLLVAAQRAAVARDFAGLVEVNSLAIALAGGAERRLETTAQGRAFLAVASASWGTGVLAAWQRLYGSEPLAYPVAVALAAAAHGIPGPAVVPAYAFAWLQNIASAATRLGIIGQTETQRMLARLARCLPALAEQALAATAEQLGGCALCAEIDAFQHETQYTRLFRT